MRAARGGSSGRDGGGGGGAHLIGSSPWRSLKGKVIHRADMRMFDRVVRWFMEARIDSFLQKHLKPLVSYIIFILDCC